MNSNICHIIQSNSVTTLENVDSAIQKTEFLAIRSRQKNNRWFHGFQQQLKPAKTGSDRYRTVQIFICIFWLILTVTLSDQLVRLLILNIKKVQKSEF